MLSTTNLESNLVIPIFFALHCAAYGIYHHNHKDSTTTKFSNRKETILFIYLCRNSENRLRFGHASDEHSSLILYIHNGEYPILISLS